MSSSLKIGPFVVHPDLNQIVRSGENVRVEPQVMKLLVFMSENPGELLSHKQIHHAVWDGTAVSDDALKRAIRVLRKTLGDDANDPRFIETLPKKGYRLIAPVSIVDGVGSASRPRSRGRRYIAVLLLVISAIAGWLFIPRGVPVPPRTNRPTVAVLPFDNLDGNPETAWLRAGLADMLITDLAQSPHLEILNPERSYTLFGNGEDTGDTSEEAHELAASSGVDILVQGSFVAAGGVLRLNARVIDTATGKILSAEKAEGLNGAGLFETVDELTRRIHSTLAVPLVADEALDRGLVEITTSSYEAYQHYAQGLQNEITGDFDTAVEHYQHALGIDPGFAMAFIRLGAVYRRSGDRDEARNCLSKAFDLRRRLSTRERLYVEGVHYLFQNDQESLGLAIERFEEAVELFPDHALARSALAFRYVFLERYDEAIEQYESLQRRGSLSPDVYEVLAECYAARGDFERGRSLLQGYWGETTNRFMANLYIGYYLPVDGRYDEALAALEQAEALRPEYKAHAGRLVVYVLQGDWAQAEMLAELRARSIRPAARRDGLLNQALIRLHRGRAEEALALFDELSMPVRSGHVLLETGRTAMALEVSENARREGKRWTDRLHGLLLEAKAKQELGFPDEAQRLSQELEWKSEWPYTDWDRRLSHRLEGEMALARGDTRLAIEELEKARSMLPPRGTHNINLEPPQHVLIWFSLGRAYWEAGELDAAARWFRRVVNSAIERYWWPIPYVRSYYFLGKIHEIQGDVEQARVFYARFVDFWRDGTMDRDKVEDALSRLKGLAGPE